MAGKPELNKTGLDASANLGAGMVGKPLSDLCGSFKKGIEKKLSKVKQSRHKADSQADQLTFGIIDSVFVKHRMFSQTMNFLSLCLS
jgi:hypothetical protein